MRFGDPQAFYFLLCVPIFALFFWWAFRRKRKALYAFGAPELMDKLAFGCQSHAAGYKVRADVCRVCFFNSGTGATAVWHRIGVDSSQGR